MEIPSYGGTLDTTVMHMHTHTRIHTEAHIYAHVHTERLVLISHAL